MPPETETRGRWEAANGVHPDPKKGIAPGSNDSGDKSLEARDGRGRKSDGDTKDGEPAYYDISLLKAPLWTPEVGTYFFLGGMSSACFSVARLADRFGRGQYREVTKAGTLIAALAALPCAPLLIWDLGDRSRFHHMLRVWKPSSPMNLGSWTLTVYTLTGGIAALRELLRVRRHDAALSGAGRIIDETAGLVADGVGVPLGLLLAGYTGVLLSTTSTPVWSRNSWIGALFSASAVSAGTGAVRLALEVVGQDGAGTEALGKVETAAHIAEAIAQVGFVREAGPLAKPLLVGGQKTLYWTSVVAGVILPEVLNRVPVARKHKRWMSVAAGVVSLVGGFALRHAFVEAGRPSALDLDAARLATGERGGTA